MRTEYQTVAGLKRDKRLEYRRRSRISRRDNRSQHAYRLCYPGTGTIRGILKVNEKTEVVYGSSDTKVNNTEKYTSKDIEKELKNKSFLESIFTTKVVAFIFSFINQLLIGFILLALFKKKFTKLASIKNDVGYVFGKIGLGLCMLILIPIIIIALLLTGFASLVGVIGIFAYITAIIVSTSVVAINYGNIVLKKNKNVYLNFLFALIALQIIKLIPVIGGLVTFLALCLGLGLLKDLFQEEKKEK